MEILSFDSFEAAEEMLNSLELGEIEEATWQPSSFPSMSFKRWHSATDMQLRTLRFWQGGGIIFKNRVPKSSKLVLKYMLEANWHVSSSHIIFFVPCEVDVSGVICHCFLPWWRCGVGTPGQEDFLSFLQDATQEPEKFELSESDEIKAMWIYGWFRLILEKPFMHFSHDVWTIFRSKVVDLMWLRLIVSWQMLTDTDIDRCW